MPSRSLGRRLSRRLRFTLETPPLRRSPRFFPQSQHLSVTGPPPQPLRRSPRFLPTNNPQTPPLRPQSEDLLSGPALRHQSSVRRSTRFLSNMSRNEGDDEASNQRKPRLQSTPKAEASAKKISQRCSMKRQSERSVPPNCQNAVPQSVRRSVRLASNPAVPTLSPAEGRKRVSGRKEMPQQRLTRSSRSASKSREKGVNLDSREGGRAVLGSESAQRKRRKQAVVLTPREGVARKRRKVEMGGRVDAGSGIGEMGEMGQECCGLQGWTKEQQEALQRAFLMAKPSPHFWKKVSKMVPGKSAKECFDRVHADFATPPQHQPHTRTNRSNISPIGSINLLASKPREFTMPKTRRPRSSKQKNLIAQKTVRHLLRKHRLIDQNQEADLFSVLENSPTALTLDFPEIKTPASTPKCVSSPLSFLQKCKERSSSAHNKTLSRFRTANKANFDSPEVLKQVKNIALHEKYIDRLHFREARRKACAETTNTVAAIDYKKKGAENSVVLKAAKNALICEAKDVISQFQSMQANIMEDDESFDIDDNDAYSDDEEDE